MQNSTRPLLTRIASDSLGRRGSPPNPNPRQAQHDAIRDHAPWRWRRKLVLLDAHLL
jgi:hypothetical protein